MRSGAALIRWAGNDSSMRLRFRLRGGDGAAEVDPRRPPRGDAAKPFAKRGVIFVWIESNTHDKHKKIFIVDTIDAIL